MRLVNGTGFPAGFTLSVDKEGREHLVVAVKATFSFPRGATAEPPIASVQRPLIETDEFTGEPGFSAPLAENDFAPYKPRCDVLVTARAHAPGGRPADRVPVAVRVGAMQKSFDVVGDRAWRASSLTLGISKATPFVTMPITYDRAFGGIDRAKGEETTWRWYSTNHAGIGWHEYLDTKFVDGTPLPNTESASDPVRKPNGTYKPMALGPIGRSWEPRPRWVGTYDQKWKDETYPFLPSDFDDRYFQSAPEDQQIAYPVGGEGVELTNLTPDARVAFQLPRLAVPVEVFLKAGGRALIPMAVDTVDLRPDDRTVALVLRGRHALRRDLHEVKLVTVGEQPVGWHQEQGLIDAQASKPHYQSLGVLTKPATPTGEGR